MALPLAGTADLAAYDLRPAAMRQAGARILQLLASLVAGRPVRMPIHKALQIAWAPDRVQVAEIIRAAMVVSADHELNVSTFAARCAASAGATAYDIVSGALATLKGYKHGGETERVATLFAEAKSLPDKTVGSAARAVIGNRLRRGERLPGFGHPLYPGGDPRAVFLLRLAQASGNTKEWRRVKSLTRAARDLLQLSPNLDFGLVAIARTYGLPKYAPLILFALGRSAGWIAHAIEQQAAGNLIRPRARYTGPAPEP
jgi:citrate synthase